MHDKGGSVLKELIVEPNSYHRTKQSRKGFATKGQDRLVQDREQPRVTTFTPTDKMTRKISNANSAIAVTT